jgi:glycosyltransferase involved in cell wall biosynthesis
MAAGVPAVQPDRGAFSEIIGRTAGGVLVQPDNPSSLAEAIHALWKNPQLRAELARNGVEGVRRHYGVAQMAARSLEVYEKIAAASPRS